MTERLQQVWAQVEQLDPAEQDTIAELIQQKLKELHEQQEWRKLVSSPQSLRFLDKLFAEAEAGEIEEGGWDIE